jgi:hypothetical protein
MYPVYCNDVGTFPLTAEVLNSNLITCWHSADDYGGEGFSTKEGVTYTTSMTGITCDNILFSLYPDATFDPYYRIMGSPVDTTLYDCVGEYIYQGLYNGEPYYKLSNKWYLYFDGSSYCLGDMVSSPVSTTNTPWEFSINTNIDTYYFSKVEPKPQILIDGVYYSDGCYRMDDTTVGTYYSTEVEALNNPISVNMFDEITVNIPPYTWVAYTVTDYFDMLSVEVSLNSKSPVNCDSIVTVKVGNLVSGSFVFGDSEYASDTYVMQDNRVVFYNPTSFKSSSVFTVGGDNGGGA